MQTLSPTYWFKFEQRELICGFLIVYEYVSKTTIKRSSHQLRNCVQVIPESLAMVIHVSSEVTTCKVHFPGRHILVPAGGRLLHFRDESVQNFDTVMILSHLPDTAIRSR